MVGAPHRPLLPSLPTQPPSEFYLQDRPEFCIDRLMCAMFARQRAAL